MSIHMIGLKREVLRKKYKGEILCNKYKWEMSGNKYEWEISHNKYKREILHNKYKWEILHNKYKQEILHTCPYLSFPNTFEFLSSMQARRESEHLVRQRFKASIADESRSSAV